MTRADDNLRLRERLSPIQTAHDLVETERNEIEAECDAFSAFEEAVSSCQAHRHQMTPQPLTVQTTSDTASTADIRESYREIVMNMPHYDSAYGEPLSESLQQEFGSELAQWLSTDSPVTPSLKSFLLAAVEECNRDREQVLKALETEDDSLSDSYSALVNAVSSGERSSGEMDLQTPSTVSLEQACDRVITERQETINTRQSFASLDGHDLRAYLYQEASWTYPVLTSVTSILHRFGAED